MREDKMLFEVELKESRAAGSDLFLLRRRLASNRQTEEEEEEEDIT